MTQVVTVNGSPIAVTIGVTGPQGPAGPSIAAGAAGQFYVTNAAATAPEWKSLSGDVTDSATTTGQITVTGLQGAITLSGAAASGNVLTATSSSAAHWAAPAPNGITQLTGDVTAGPGSGSQAATVVRVNGATVPAAGALTTGNAAYVSGVSALTYSALNLAGGSGWVTGVLPAANQAAQTMGGEISGTTAAATIVPGTAGQIAVSNASPAFAWTSLISYETTHGRFQAGNGGTDVLVIIGPKFGNETSLAAMYLLPHATSPNASNYAIYGDGANQFVTNTPGGNPVYFWQAAGTTVAKWDFSTSTTPLLQVGTSATSFTIGTNKSAAALALQADVATTIQTLASTGTELANLSTPAAGTGPRIFGHSGRVGQTDAHGHILYLPGG